VEQNAAGRTLVSVFVTDAEAKEMHIHFGAGREATLGRPTPRRPK
jgi:hypothetical protein